MKVSYRSDIQGVSDICSGTLVTGEPGTRIETITTDSRDLGEKNLFIPLVGENFDGHDFIDPLVENRSIECFLTMKEGFSEIAHSHHTGCINCSDTLDALGKIALSHRENMNPEIIGITGTNGKTTVKELLFFILSQKYNCLKNEKNYNNEIGVPFTLLGLNEQHEVAVIEMGMNHQGEIDRLSKMTKPDISVITNIGEGHLEFLGNVENVALSKSEILSGMKTGSRLYINRDTEHFDTVIARADEMGINVRTFGITGEADIFPDDFTLTGDSIHLIYKDRELLFPLYGYHNVYNIMAVIGVVEDFGVNIADYTDSVAGFRNIAGRSQVIEMDFVVIDDTYNSNPLSSRYALLSVKNIYPDRRKIAVLSDMKELGDLSPHYHEKIGNEVAESGFHLLLVLGEMSSYYIKGAVDKGFSPGNTIIFESRDDIVDYLLENIREEDVVLIKGSRSMKMDEVVNSLVKIRRS